MKPQDAWRATQGQLKVQLNRSTYDTWVRDCEFVAYQDGIFTFSVKNAYIKDWLEKRLYRSIRHTLSGIFREPVELEFVVAKPQPLPIFLMDELETEASPEEVSPPPVVATRRDNVYTTPTNHNSLVWNSHLNGNYTFDNFVVGVCNQLAHAAAQAVVERPAQAYNPLFVYGNSGVGKTHLLHGIGHLLNRKGMRVLYTTAEQFTNHLVDSIRRKQTVDFRDQYRNVDILLVDDVQFLASKDNIQEEFFHTFNALHSQGKQMILASDRHPDEIPELGERLRSRFVWGLLVQIHEPEYATRVAILTDKAEMQGYRLPREVAHLIAEQVEGNVRNLEGALNQVLAFSTLMGTGLTLASAEKILHQTREPRDQVAITRRLSLADVLEATATCYQMRLSELIGKSRRSDVAVARQIAIYVAREETDASLPEIGDALGRNHTTILYSYNKIAKQIEADAELRAKVESIRKLLYTA